MIASAKILSGHPSSKISLENMEVFANVWETQVEEWTTLLRNVTNFDKRQGSESKFLILDFINQQWYSGMMLGSRIQSWLDLYDFSIECITGSSVCSEMLNHEMLQTTSDYSSILGEM